MRCWWRFSMGRFCLRRDGVASIEFAMVVPVLVTLLVGSLGAFDSYRATRLMTVTASTLVDVVTRQGEITEETQESLIVTAKSLLGSYAEKMPLTLAFVSVYRPTDDPLPADDDVQTLAVDWFHVHQDGVAEPDIEAADILATVSVPILTPGDSVVVVSLAASYKPMIGQAFFDGLVLRKTAIRRPRFVQRLQLTEG